MRLAALQSVVNTGPAGVSGYPRPRRRRGFPCVPVARRSVSSPASLRKRVHPLLSLASSSECEPLRTCSAHGCEERLPWGLVPNRDISHGDPLADGDPNPALCSALGVSHALDGLLPPRPCGLVSSRNHVRDSPFRGLFPPPSRTDSSSARALLSLTMVSCQLVAERLQIRWPRLQGVDPGGDPQPPLECLAPAAPDPLVGFTPSGSSPDTLAEPSLRLRS